jgi:hypothetical protein
VIGISFAVTEYVVFIAAFETTGNKWLGISLNPRAPFRELYRMTTCRHFRWRAFHPVAPVVSSAARGTFGREPHHERISHDT